MNVLVTGATGFIGSQVVRALLRDGHSVRASRRPDRPPAAIADLAERIEWVSCDLWQATEDERARLCDGIELCVHAAWFAVPGEYLESPVNLACMRGTLELLDSLIRARCPRVALVGTCFEYRFGPEPLSESAAIDPGSLYAATKAATGLLARQVTRAHGTSFVWLRPFYQYGPYEHPRRLVPAVIRSLLRGETVDVTSGRQVRDFLHVRDVGTAIVAAATSDLDGIVNIGAGRAVTVREIVETIESLVGVPGLVRFGARPDHPTDPPYVVADVGKLVGATGWSPAFDLRAGLDDTVAWWKARQSPS